jgi:hypothetical protein
MSEHFSTQHIKSELATVHSSRCIDIARLIGTWKVPQDRENLDFLDLPSNLIGNFFLFLVSICHQTSPPNSPPLQGKVGGVILRGWDYLLQRFYEHARGDLSLLNPTIWANLKGRDVQLLFTDSEFGDRLIDPEFRSYIIRDLGTQMIASGWANADELHKLCGGRIAIGDPNLFTVLARFRAYNDPVRKKSCYFLSLMRNTGTWTYADIESLGPPVDYHEVRGHLRIGTISISDPNLLTKIHQGKKVSPTEDVILRQAVYQAIMLISSASGLRNPSQLHYLFWNIFRSVCLREDPQCYNLKPSCSLPERYRHLASSQGCPFASLCESAGQSKPIIEHLFETDYY